MLTVHDVTAAYGPQPVLRNINLGLERGETLGLVGPSGCGKSTLVRVLALLLAPTEGTVAVDGEVVRHVRYRAPRRVRRAIGVVFQSPRRSADPRLTLHEIIATPLWLTRMPVDRRVAELADLVGLTADLLARRPHEVSDGQLQRACLARALALRPRYLLCDEMTAMLDASTTAALVDVVRRTNAEEGTGVLAVSHDHELLAVWADRTLALTPDGSLQSPPEPTPTGRRPRARTAERE